MKERLNREEILVELGKEENLDGKNREGKIELRATAAHYVLKVCETDTKRYWAICSRPLIHSLSTFTDLLAPHVFLSSRTRGCPHSFANFLTRSLPNSWERT